MTMPVKLKNWLKNGLAMLSGVLNSDRAIAVNVAIMRAFVKLRELISSHRDLSRRMDELEGKYDAQFRGVFRGHHLPSPPDAARLDCGGVRCRKSRPRPGLAAGSRGRYRMTGPRFGRSGGKAAGVAGEYCGARGEGPSPCQEWSKLDVFEMHHCISSFPGPSPVPGLAPGRAWRSYASEFFR